jgi:transposase
MNRVHTLSEEEIDVLERLHRRTDDANLRSRCDMILLSNEGLSPPEIAERVRFSCHTVVRYIKRYKAEGLDGLFTKPRSRRPRRVTREHEARLLAAVEQGLARWGCPS